MAIGHVEQHAKLYLHACVQAVMIAELNLSEDTLPKAWEGKSCNDAAFALQNHPGLLRGLDLSAVRLSRIAIGSGAFDDFQVTVVDRDGHFWKGDPQHAMAVPPLHSPSPSQLTTARAASEEVLAQNVLRKCVEALSEQQIDQPEQFQEWEAKSCQDVPNVFSGSQFFPAPSSQIHLRPETEQAFEVTVTAVSGQVYHWPESLTPKPPVPPPQRPEPAWVRGLLSMLTGALLLVFLAAIPGGGVSMGLAFGILGAVLLPFFTVGSHGTEWVGFFFGLLTIAIGVWLVSSVLGAVLRQLYSKKQEMWLESLGSSLLWGLFPAGAVTVGLLNGASSLTPLFGDWYWLMSALGSVVLFVLIEPLRRRFAAFVRTRVAQSSQDGPSRWS